LASDRSIDGGMPLVIRRVVTGHDQDGKAVVAFEDTTPRTNAFKHVPGLISRMIWATPPVPSLPFDRVDPTPAVKSTVPPPGETRFLIITFPPDSVFAAADFDPVAAAAENLEVSPGLAELFEPDGMHTTDTVDFALVLDGEIWLELDDGRTTQLRRHDVVIQNGTRHAWRNKSKRGATLAFVLIGARRRGRTVLDAQLASAIRSETSK
jgi:hypothetical protein